jgi:hypothetical protein
MKSMKMFAVPALLVVFVTSAFGGENLTLNSKLDYSSDRQDGPLITGDHMDAGFTAGKPAYVIIYQEGCFNSKRQARRTVSLYGRYKGRVQFVVIDLDHALSPAQQELQKKYFRGYIPHVVVLDAAGVALYNASGEVEENTISSLLDKTLR